MFSSLLCLSLTAFSAPAPDPEPAPLPEADASPSPAPEPPVSVTPPSVQPAEQSATPGNTDVVNGAGQISVEAPPPPPRPPTSALPDWGAESLAEPTALPRQDSRRLLYRGRALTIAGFASFGFSYVLVNLAAGGRNQLLPLIPVVGAWIYAPTSSKPAFDVVGGIVQAAGLTVGFVGVHMTRQWRKGVRLTGMPMRHGSGLMVFGRF